MVAGRTMRCLVPFVLLLALAACEREPASPPTPSPAATATSTPSPTPTAPASPAAKPVFDLPERFTALGTEPFWAVEVDGARLTYRTPENQVGQAAAVTRTPGDDFVELRGTLAGQALTLTVSKGPCSDGMSDTVYAYRVTRRLGDDTQRGCARPG